MKDHVEKRQRNHNIRFNLENEEARKAWENLHSKEVETDFKSLNAFVITAINDYYERHLQIKADSYFETREKEDAFAERMVQMVLSYISKRWIFNVRSLLFFTGTTAQTHDTSQNKNYF